MQDIGGDLGQILDTIRFIPPPLLREILIVAILSLVAINLSLFLSIVIHRAWVDYRDKRYKRAYQKYTEQVSTALFMEANIKKPKNAIEMEALGDVCIEIKRKFRGETEKKIVAIAKKTGVVDYYMKLARSRITNTRVVAYEKLAFLGISSVKEVLRREIEREKRHWVVARLCFAYTLMVEDTSEVSFLFDKLTKFENISFKFLEFLWYELLGKFHSEGNISELLSFVEGAFLSKRLNLVAIRAFIEAVGNMRLIEGVEFVLKIYDREKQDTLVRLSCIRALGTIGFENFCEIFLENVKHEDWRIRTVVCKFAYLCPEEVAIEHLKELFSDENYYVRINAGKALLHFSERAKPVLESLLESEDKFARDTARYLLEEMELKHA